VTATPPPGLSEAELAAWQYEHRDELDAQIEGDEVVKTDEDPREVLAAFERGEGGFTEGLYAKAEGAFDEMVKRGQQVDPVVEIDREDR